MSEYRFRTTLRMLRQTSGWSIAAFVLLVTGIAIHSLLLIACFGVLVVVSVVLAISEAGVMTRAGMSDLDEMTGWEFEKWLVHFFTERGFGVRRTPYRGDFGADLLLTWNGMRIAVQAKRSARPVGVAAVQQVVAAKAYYDCEAAMVVTNNFFTDQAHILARANGVKLRHREDLAKGLTEMQLKAGRLVAITE